MNGMTAVAIALYVAAGLLAARLGYGKLRAQKIDEYKTGTVTVQGAVGLFMKRDQNECLVAAFAIGLLWPLWAVVYAFIWFVAWSPRPSKAELAARQDGP